MAGKTLSYHANEAVVGWISGQAALEGRSTSQIIGDALQLYRALPEAARRSLRLARQRGQEGPVMRVAARAILTALEEENRREIAAQIRATGRPLPDTEDDLLEEAVRLADPA
jgi:hypothetical protein